MSIDTPNDNVKLNFDQLQAIDTAQKRLSVLESEVGIAQKILKGTKMEIDRAVKEKAYQEEILGTVSAQLNEKKSFASKLDEDILAKQAELHNILSEYKNHSDKMTAEKMEMKDAKDALLAQEKFLASKSLLVSSGSKDLEDNKSEFNEKVSKLKEVISTF